MSKYTTEVRFICETAYGLKESKGAESVDAIVEGASPKIFNFAYPIFDENYRRVLEKKILKHYYTREIGEESVGLWQLRLNTRLNEIMPYYNKLYNSELIEFSPFDDVDYTKTGNRNTDGSVDESGNESVNKGRNDSISVGKDYNSTATNNIDITDTRTDNLEALRTDNLESLRTDNLTSEVTNDLFEHRFDNLDSIKTGNSADKYSDTPQGALTGVVSGNYLTNARVVDDTNHVVDNNDYTTENTGTQTNTNRGTQSEKNTGTQTQKNTGTQTAEKEGTESTVTIGSEDINTNLSSTESGSTNKSNNKNIKNTEDYIERVIGKVSTASKSELLMKFRETFLNIDMLVIRDLEDLFFQLW